MPPSLDPAGLLPILQAEDRLLADLLTLLEREKAMLEASDLDGLSGLERERESLLALFGGLEARRRRLLAGDPTPLSAVISMIPPPAGPALAALRESILDRLATIKLSMRRNSQLYHQAMGCVQIVLDALRFPEGRLTLYGPGAETREQGRGNSVFELKL